MSKMEGTETVPLASCREMRLWSPWWTAAGPRIPTVCFFSERPQFHFHPDGSLQTLQELLWKLWTPHRKTIQTNLAQQFRRKASSQAFRQHLCPVKELGLISHQVPLGRSRRFCCDSTKHNVFTSGSRRHKTYYVALLLKWPVGNVKLPTEVWFKGCFLEVGALTESWKQKCWRHQRF